MTKSLEGILQVSIYMKNPSIVELPVGVPSVSSCKREEVFTRTCQWQSFMQRSSVHHLLLTQSREGQALRKGSVCITSSMAAGQQRRLPAESKCPDTLDALDSMDQQRMRSIKAYRGLLRRCTEMKALEEAKRVHAHIVRHGLESSRYLGDLLLDMFVQCGSLSDALEVLYRLRERTSFSWTVVISGYVKAGLEQDAFRLYHRMQEEGLQPNKYTFVSLLKACGSLSNLGLGRKIHFDICRTRCDSELFVGTTLVAMYAKCGSMDDARHVFDTLSQHDVVSWNAMIAGYTQQNRCEEALELYAQMKVGCVKPDSWTFVSALKACGSLANDEHVTLVNDQYLKPDGLQYGKRIHSEAFENGHPPNVFVGTALVDMYAKCGSLLDAEHVFHNLPERSVVSWNAMLSGYVQQEQGVKALQLYVSMQQAGVSPDNWTVVSALKACGNLAALEKPCLLNVELVSLECLQKGKLLYEHAVRRGHGSDLFLGNTVVDIYADCGSLMDARYLFDSLDKKNVVSWNAMIGGYSFQEQGNLALQLYAQMWEDGVTPTDRTFVSALKSCTSIAATEPATLVDGQAVKLNCLQAGKAIHADVVHAGLESDLLVAHSLIHMYAKCGSMKDAHYIFDSLPDSNVVAWTYMITGYVEQDLGDIALRLYAEMQGRGVGPDQLTCVSVLKACGSQAAKEQTVPIGGEMIRPECLQSGKRIHDSIVSSGFALDVHLGTALVDMYIRCGSMVSALQVFEVLSQHDVVLWTTMIAGYVEQGQIENALRLYSKMKEQGVCPDSYTYVSLLKACGTQSMFENAVLVGGENVKPVSLHVCKGIHAEVVQSPVSDLFVNNSLIDTYATCGSIMAAQHVFQTMPHRNLVSWNTMIACYAQQGEMALQLFGRMQEEGLSPNNRTFVSVLQACGSLSSREQATVINGESLKVDSLRRVKEIHDQIDSRGYSSNAYLSKALLEIYAACGSMRDAEAVFDALRERNVVTWTAMIAAYAQKGQNERAMQHYVKMQQDGVKPNDVTFFNILRACGNLGALTACHQIHVVIIENGLNFDTRVATSLIHAYSKCGSIVDARHLFDTLPAHDVFSWTALIAGYARQGEVVTSLQLFKEMQDAGIKPNEVTLLSVLAACSHAGMVEMGLMYFESIGAANNLTLTIDHYVSLVDLLGRAGLFDEVREVVASMPMQPNLALWLSLLAAAQKHKNVALGRLAFERALSLDENSAAP